MSDHQPSGIDGSSGAGLDVGLAEEEREAGAEQHQRDADGDVVDACGKLQNQPWKRRTPRRESPAASTPTQGEPVR